MDLEKFEKLNNKMNKITEELTKNIGLSEEMLTTTEELEGYLKPLQTSQELIVTQKVELSDPQESTQLAPVTEIAASVVDVQAMIDDFTYMRQMLRETTQNSKRVLESVTEELVLGDGESRAGLVMAYGELNKAQIESIKLFMQSYREVSTILVNLSKVSNAGTPHTVHTTNVLNIEDKTAISSADIVKRLRG